MSEKKGTSHPVMINIPPPEAVVDPHMIEVPVTVQFDQDKVIGSLRIDKTQLPKTPSYLFAIGGSVKDAGMEWSESLGRQVFTIKYFELEQVSLIPENQYDWQKAGDVWLVEKEPIPEPEVEKKPKPRKKSVKSATKPL